MPQLTADSLIPECLAQRSFLVAECTIPADLTIREWRVSRRGQSRRTRMPLLALAPPFSRS